MIYLWYFLEVSDHYRPVIAEKHMKAWTRFLKKHNWSDLSFCGYCMSNIAKMQKCKNAKMQKCKNAKMQKCKNAKMQKCHCHHLSETWWHNNSRIKNLILMALICFCSPFHALSSCIICPILKLSYFIIGFIWITGSHSFEISVSSVSPPLWATTLNFSELTTNAA